jgi:serine/threonine-protein kinase
VSLTAGSRLGPYEIVSPIGAGGMGVVYRARDTRLGRDVALKVLPEDLARSVERRARFERESRLLATLNHSGIAGIHDVLEDAGTPILVMELVEGETLDERLRRGPLPLRQALEVGRQMAEALEAAHEKGVIHRDLKPSNVMLTPEGKAKLLDFGLAKALETGSGEAKGEIFSSVETLTSPAKATGMGAVLGTAPYMSPEQARGEGLDKRTDVWAFGCVLFELLTGHRAFPGATRTEAIAAVLEREPIWSALPQGAPAAVQALLRRCLRKDKAERLRDIGDAQIELKEALEELSSGTTSPPAGAAATRGARSAAPPYAWPLWIGGLLIVGLVAGLGGWVIRSWLAAPSTPAARLTFSPPVDVKLLTIDDSYQHLAAAPDGKRVAFLGSSARGVSVYLREVGEIEAKLVPDGENARSPFFSPDGRWLGFAQGSRLMKVPLGGGSPVPVCDIPGEAGSPGEAGRVRGASWGSEGTIVFSPAPNLGLWRVPAEGGTPRPLTTPNAQKSEMSHRWPHVLPGGRSALFTIWTSQFARDARIGVVSLETGEYRVILEGTGFARYFSTGHILYAKLGLVLAVPFDIKRLAVTGPPVTVLNDVQMALDGHFYADLDVSDSGALVFVPGAPRLVERSLFWVDRQGRAEPVTSTRRAWNQPRLSPNGRRLALTVGSDLSDPENTDIWLLDLERDTSDRITSGGGDYAAVWSPDGARVAFVASTASGRRLTTVAADGDRSPEPVGETAHDVSVLDEWSRDGHLLVFSQQNPGRRSTSGSSRWMRGACRVS